MKRTIPEQKCLHLHLRTVQRGVKRTVRVIIEKETKGLWEFWVPHLDGS